MLEVADETQLKKKIPKSTLDPSVREEEPCEMSDQSENASQWSVKYLANQRMPAGYLHSHP